MSGTLPEAAAPISASGESLGRRVTLDYMHNDSMPQEIKDALRDFDRNADGTVTRFDLKAGADAMKQLREESRLYCRLAGGLFVLAVVMAFSVFGLTMWACELTKEMTVSAQGQLKTPGNTEVSVVVHHAAISSLQFADDSAQRDDTNGTITMLIPYDAVKTHVTAFQGGGEPVFVVQIPGSAESISTVMVRGSQTASGEVAAHGTAGADWGQWEIPACSADAAQCTVFVQVQTDEGGSATSENLRGRRLAAGSDCIKGLNGCTDHLMRVSHLG